MFLPIGHGGRTSVDDFSGPGVHLLPPSGHAFAVVAPFAASSLLPPLRFVPAALASLALLAASCVGSPGDELTVAADPSPTTSPSSRPGSPTSTTVASTTAATTIASTTIASTTIASTTVVPALPADQRVLEHRADLTGDLASKSVVASGTGVYVAQNMMYRHTISVFDADKSLVATVPDSVDLGRFAADLDPVALGLDSASGTYQGAPVEAAFDSTGRYAYISNYRMYGPGFDADPGDGCNKDQGDPSLVYRLDTTKVATPTEAIDRVYAVGSVPKYVAVTPDDRLLLVSNWCTFDLSIIDLTSGTTLATIELGRHPRGIAVTQDSGRAYVTVMGGSDIAVVDLAGFEVSWLKNVGASPRHLVLSPDDSTLYATLNGEGTVIKIDTASGEVTDRVSTGVAPRSMARSTDGTALYVVNYESDTMTKLRAADFEILDEVSTAHHPIGITYDRFNDEVWIACYSGVIHVYAETDPVAAP